MGFYGPANAGLGIYSRFSHYDYCRGGNLLCPLHSFCIRFRNRFKTSIKRGRMKTHHWIGAVILVVVGIVVGVKYPQWFASIPGLSQGA